MIEQLAAEPRGLIIVTGAAGSGRTTTVAAIIDHVNAHRAAHIVTLEDPIEVLHEDKQSLVSQREVGADTGSLLSGIRRAGRQDADVIFVGELRDVEVAAAVALRGRLGPPRRVDHVDALGRGDGPPAARALPARPAGAGPASPRLAPPRA